jgi:uncharacterized membrane protein YbhN (UPF0104 family)
MNRYWFRKRKGLFSQELGWGFIPISIEGSVCYIILFCLIGFLFFHFNLIDPTFYEGIYFTIALILVLITFSYIAKFKTKDK